MVTGNTWWACRKVDASDLSEARNTVSSDVFRRSLRQNHALWRADRAAVDPTPRRNPYSAGTPVVPRVVSLLPAGRAARSAFGGTTSVASPIHTRKRMVR